MRKFMLFVFSLTALCFLLVKNSIAATVDRWQMNMPKGVSPISHEIYELHMIVIGVCAVIGIIVFGVMFYALFKHRKSKGYQAAHFHENSTIEIIWTIIPFLILVGLAIPATKVLMKMDDTKASEVTIKIIGYQWKWEYEYLDQGVRFFSSLKTPYQEIENQQQKSEWYLLDVDHPLVVPIHKKIRFLVTSNDVVHSWWVPDLGVKRDAIPGFIHEAWTKIEKPGTYRGQCAELCGVNHGFMPIVVKAVSKSEYNDWLAAEKARKPEQISMELSRDTLMKLGKDKYRNTCAACHGADGKGLPPLYPALKGSSVAVGASIERHIDIILHGVPGSAMQRYAEQLSDEEIAAIVTYERNAWNNNTNDLVQPSAVRAVREQKAQTPIFIKKAQQGGFQ